MNTPAFRLVRFIALIVLAAHCPNLLAQDVFSIDDCEVKPQIVKAEQPIVPDSLAKQAGTVKVKFVISQEGRAVNLEVSSSTNGALDQLAIDTVKQWRFSPAQRQGQPVPVMTIVPIRFKADS